MNSTDLLSPSDEIDIKEIFVCLWVYKFLIVTACGVFILFGSLYVLAQDKIFTSKTMFKISQNSGGGISLGGDIGALASLAGMGAGGMGSEVIPTEEIKGRVFIEQIDKILDLKSDRYFNKYLNNQFQDPKWKATLKRFLGYHFGPVTEEAVWQGIVSLYYKNIDLEITDGNTIMISASHESPIRAAKIANTIMETILANETKKKNFRTKDQLEYLSKTIANSLSELELAQSNLKNYVVENNALPLEKFYADSLQLESLREKLNRTNEFYDAAFALQQVMKKENIGNDDYLYLSKNFPIIDQADFRRTLGQSQVSGSWFWPQSSTITTLVNTLSSRKKLLTVQINTSQKNTELAGRKLEDFAKLKREEKIAEATYAVLTEQVKAQSMTAGYKPDSSVVYEYASPSIFPSAPNIPLYVGFSAFIGLFLSVILSFVLSSKRKVYYTNNTLFMGAKADFELNAKALYKLRNKKIDDLTRILNKKSNSILRDISVEIHKSSLKFIAITSLNNQISSIDVALMVSSYMQQDALKIAIINTTHNKKITYGKVLKVSENFDNNFQIANLDENISLLMPKSSFNFLSQRNFSENLEPLNKSFDLVFVCADNFNAISLIRALELRNVFHLTLARIKHTKQQDLVQLSKIKPIQGLLHV